MADRNLPDRFRSRPRTNRDPRPQPVVKVSRRRTPPARSVIGDCLAKVDEDRLCCLVIVGVRPDGTKELVALADGYRESKESWAALLRSLRERGLAGPVLAVGDGALGFWAALRDVFPSTKEQRCWVHKTANCTDALPKRLHPQAK